MDPTRSGAPAPSALPASPRRRGVRRPTPGVVLAGALVLLAACAPARFDATPRPATTAWDELVVTNQNREPLDLYPSLAGTTLWTRIGRVPPHATRTVRIPASYLRRDFSVVVCRPGGMRGARDCTRTQRHPVRPDLRRVVIFPHQELTAEFR